MCSATAATWSTATSSPGSTPTPAARPCKQSRRPPAGSLAIGHRAPCPSSSTSALGLADEATARLGLHIGCDLGYWSTVRAGTGSFAAITYRNLGGGELWGIALGGQLRGGN